MRIIIFLSIIFGFYACKTESSIFKSEFFGNEHFSRLYLMNNKQKLDSLDYPNWYGSYTINKWEDGFWQVLYKQRSGGTESHTLAQLIISVKDNKLVNSFHGIQLAYGGFLLEKGDSFQMDTSYLLQLDFYKSVSGWKANYEEKDGKNIEKYTKDIYFDKNDPIFYTEKKVKYIGLKSEI